MKLIFLIDGQRGRMLKCGGQRRRFADAIEFFHQRLDAERGEVANEGNEMFGRTVLVFYHGVADARLVGKIPCRIREERGDSVLSFQGFDEGFDGLRENRILRACPGRGADLRELQGLVLPLDYGLKSFWLSTIVPEAPGAPRGGMALPFNSSNTVEESPAVTSNC